MADSQVRSIYPSFEALINLIGVNWFPVVVFILPFATTALLLVALSALDALTRRLNTRKLLKDIRFVKGPRTHCSHLPQCPDRGKMLE